MIWFFLDFFSSIFFFCDPVRSGPVRSDPGFVDATFLSAKNLRWMWSIALALSVTSKHPFPDIFHLTSSTFCSISSLGRETFRIFVSLRL